MRIDSYDIEYFQTNKVEKMYVLKTKMSISHYRSFYG